MQSRGHILILNERDPQHPRAGGAEVHVQEIGRRLVERGWAVTQTAISFAGAPSCEVLDGVEIIRLGPLPVYYPRAIWTCARGTRSGRFDVVVEHLNKLPFLSPLYSATPVVAVCHHLFGSTAFQQVSWPVAATVWSAEKLIPAVYRRASMVAVSESTRADLVERGVDADQIRIIHNGIAQTHVPDLPPPSERRCRMAYLGRLEPYKRVDVMLRAARSLVPRFPDLEIVIVGRGTDAERLERVAGELGLSERTRFTGFVSDAERDALLSDSRVCLCPSLKEGWGITVLEANVFGVPVVATDAPGLRDAVRPGETGFLVATDDEAGFAQRAAEVLADDALADRLSLAAREWATKFDWDGAAEAMGEVLEHAVRGV